MVQFIAVHQKWLTLNIFGCVFLFLFFFFPSSPSNSTCRTNFMSFLDLTQNWELHFKYAHLTFIWKKNSSSICCCCCCWVKPKFSHLFRFKCFPSGHLISIRKQMREVIPTTCLFPEASDAQMYGSIGFVANFCVCKKNECWGKISTLPATFSVVRICKAKQRFKFCSVQSCLLMRYRYILFTNEFLCISYSVCLISIQDLFDTACTIEICRLQVNQRRQLSQQRYHHQTQMPKPMVVTKDWPA